ncbi:MAG: hypothetical protein F2923_02875 [Actinobacteria bacterium]|uniref:Unannotated protein n=1 Tax=freshwater metagenome TaxID=449393 RepID=A0A6J7S822_9ZZZZ|nr:hypothetical protein [Actinomycetota bacterium]MTB27565.1 hypothetical protein [Actinomycetota bacterium]
MSSRPWLRSVTPIAPPAAENPTWRFLVYAGIVTGAWSGLLSLVIYAIGRVCGVPFMASQGQGDSVGQILWLAPLLIPVLVAIVGALLSVLVLGRNHARHIVFWSGSLVALISIAGPVMQPDAVLWSTRILLLCMHAITWFLVVPQLARIVGDSEPQASEVRVYNVGSNL